MAFTPLDGDKPGVELADNFTVSNATLKPVVAILLNIRGNLERE